MRCAACGHDNRETAAFCEACGGRLALVCSRCSNELRPGARFCDACGQPVATPVLPPQVASTQPQTPPLTPPSSTVSDALEGERKQVTILFADVVGSTPMIRGRDEED